MEEKKIKSLSISAKSFIASVSIIVGLMIFAYVLTFVLKAGEYSREVVNGVTQIVPNSYKTIEGVKFPFWKFLLSPFLTLGGDGGLTIIGIVIFLLIVGGIFEILNQIGLIEYLLHKVVHKFYNRRFILLAVLTFIFMLLATIAGCFEELIPMIPFVVAIVVSFGWDKFTGLASILVASACGYASGIMNPFSTGVAQKAAGIAPFSGLWLRIVTFVVLYLILASFIILHAKRIEKKKTFVAPSEVDNFKEDKILNKTLLVFSIMICLGLLCVVVSSMIDVLSDYTLVIFAVFFLISGISAIIVSKVPFKKCCKSFVKGLISILPAVVMILLASSIKYILEESYRNDTILNYFIHASEGMPKIAIILFIYFIVLLFELVVPSGTAKAWLIIPLVLPIATLKGIGGNLVILAYIFGDGLANVFYPTNAGLLVGLSMAESNYGSYMKTGWKLALMLFASTCLILLFGLAVGYGF